MLYACCIVGRIDWILILPFLTTPLLSCSLSVVAVRLTAAIDATLQLLQLFLLQMTGWSRWMSGWTACRPTSMGIDCLPPYLIKAGLIVLLLYFLRLPPRPLFPYRLDPATVSLLSQLPPRPLPLLLLSMSPFWPAVQQLSAI